MLSLEYLNMTSCGLRGGIPKSMGNICSLRTLNMYYNNLTGELSEFIGNLSGCTRNSLEVLLLNENQLSGSFPHNITEFSSLKVLDLSANQLTGALPNLAPSFSSLRELHLVGNRFNGNPANSFSDLLHLESLDIAYNSFKGIITEAHLSNLPQLKYLFLSQLSLETSSDWIPPFQLHLISLQSCKLGPMFPKWIRTQRNFFYLDISNAGISDTIPTWLWDLSPIRLLNLSHNHISGKLPADLWTTFSRNCRVIDLSFNDLEGTLPPLLLSNLTILTLSKNRFSGSLSSLCKIIGDNRLSALDISDNLLSGEIPNCHHTQYQNLSHLNFANNNLSGEIPSFVGTLSNLLHLDLHNNSLSGKLPPSMKNCSHLNVLDLGNNRFFGNIPSWIGESLLSLKFLILRSNEFYGEIPLQMCQLTNIKVLDLSMNKIIGIIPKCFSHFSNMAQKGNLTYYNPYSLADVGVFHSYVCPHFYGGNVIVISEGIRQYEYGRNRELLRIIDLSSNKLTGKIPSQLSNLLALQTLNLSRNSLTGTIPPRIGFLKELLSLDLSRNYLTGEIPSSMADLNFLNHLDLSYNNLSGKIPSATQVQSFNASQFLGNTLLCGLPLLQKCPGDKTIEQSQPTKNGGAGTVSEDEDEFDKWFYTGMGVGFAVGFWVICGSLVLKRSWRHAYFLLMINIKDWVYVKIASALGKIMEKLSKLKLLWTFRKVISTQLSLKIPN
ncbi:Leucine-rich repeat receptor protein kinase [Quillaja saponaria]|nr:Leucine-rich repeat receptor protein kinase [Quillaja saponaria]